MQTVEVLTDQLLTLKLKLGHKWVTFAHLKGLPLPSDAIMRWSFQKFWQVWRVVVTGLVT